MLRRQIDRTGAKEGSGRILIVDDDTETRAVLAEALSRRGYQVQGAPDGLWVSRALCAGAFCFDLVVLDWRMPGLDGLAVLQQLRTSVPDTPVILTSIAADDQLRLAALRLGAFEVLRKPLSIGVLALLVERALQQKWSGGTNH